LTGALFKATYNPVQSSSNHSMSPCRHVFALSKEEFNKCDFNHSNGLNNVGDMSQEDRFPIHTVLRHFVNLFFNDIDKLSWEAIEGFLASFYVFGHRGSLLGEYRQIVQTAMPEYVSEKKYLVPMWYKMYLTHDMFGFQRKETTIGSVVETKEFCLESGMHLGPMVERILFDNFILQHLRSIHGTNIEAINNMLDSYGNLSEDGINFRASVIKELPRIRVERAQFDKIPEQLNQYIIPIVRICSKLQKPETVRRSQRSRKRKRDDDFE